MALPWGDDEVLVFSWNPLAAQSFRRDDGQFVERYPLRTVVETVVIDSGEPWLSGAEYGDRSAIRRLAPSHLIRGRSVAGSGSGDPRGRRRDRRPADQG